jgi:hypothetical protein
MLRVLPALEAYAIANIATQNLVGGNPLQFLLGDLNTTAGTGFGAVMGPQPGVLTLKELLTGEYNYGLLTSSTGGPPGAMSPTSGYAGTSIGFGTGSGTPLEIVSANFANNFGNIVVGSVLTTAGFRIASKVLSKPRSKMNKLIRNVGLGSTIQI